jgi:predicted nuclease with TOPRIM domain
MFLCDEEIAEKDLEMVQVPKEDILGIIHDLGSKTNIEKYNMWNRRIKKMTKENTELKTNLKKMQKEINKQKMENQNFSSIQSFNTNMEIPFSVNVCKL